MRSTKAPYVFNENEASASQIDIDTTQKRDLSKTTIDSRLDVTALEDSPEVQRSKRLALLDEQFNKIMRSLDEQPEIKEVDEDAGDKDELDDARDIFAVPQNHERDDDNVGEYV